MSWYETADGRSVWVPRDEIVYTVLQPDSQLHTKELMYLSVSSSKPVYKEHSVDDDGLGIGCSRRRRNAIRMTGRERGFLVRVEHEEHARVVPWFKAACKELMDASVCSKVDAEEAVNWKKQKKRFERGVAVAVNECRVETISRCHHVACGPGLTVEAACDEVKQIIHFFTGGQVISMQEWQGRLIAAVERAYGRVFSVRQVQDETAEDLDEPTAGSDSKGGRLREVMVAPAQFDTQLAEEEDWLNTLMCGSSVEPEEGDSPQCAIGNVTMDADHNDKASEADAGSAGAADVEEQPSEEDDRSEVAQTAEGKTPSDRQTGQEHPSSSTSREFGTGHAVDDGLDSAEEQRYHEWAQSVRKQQAGREILPRERQGSLTRKAHRVSAWTKSQQWHHGSLKVRKATPILCNDPWRHAVFKNGLSSNEPSWMSGSTNASRASGSKTIEISSSGETACSEREDSAEDGKTLHAPSRSAHDWEVQTRRMAKVHSSDMDEESDDRHFSLGEDWELDDAEVMEKGAPHQEDEEDRQDRPSIVRIWRSQAKIDQESGQAAAATGWSSEAWERFHDDRWGSWWSDSSRYGSARGVQGQGWMSDNTARWQQQAWWESSAASHGWHRSYRAPWIQDAAAAGTLPTKEIIDIDDEADSHVWAALGCKMPDPKPAWRSNSAWWDRDYGSWEPSASGCNSWWEQ